MTAEDKAFLATYTPTITLDGWEQPDVAVLVWLEPDGKKRGTQAPVTDSIYINEAITMLELIARKVVARGGKILKRELGVRNPAGGIRERGSGHLESFSTG